MSAAGESSAATTQRSSRPPSHAGDARETELTAFPAMPPPPSTKSVTPASRSTTPVPAATKAPTDERPAAAVAATAPSGPAAASAAAPSASPAPAGGGIATNRAAAPASSPSSAPFGSVYIYEELGDDAAKAKGIFGLAHPLLLSASGFAFITLVLLLVAIPTVNWYIIIHGGQTMRYGLYRTCVNSTCAEIEYRDLTFPDCSRDKGGWRFRNNVAQGTALASVFLCLVIFAFTILSRRVLTETKCTIIVGASFGSIVLILIGGIVRFVFTYEIWLFCDKNFCDYMEQIGDTKTCDASFGYSFGLVLIAIGSSLVGAIFCVVKALLRDYTFTKKREIPRAAQPESPTSPRTLAGFPAAGASPSTAAAQASRPRAIPPPPPGDWEFQEDCGLYWSAAEFLYLDPFTGHFNDPNSGQWYDAEANVWYEGVTPGR